MCRWNFTDFMGQWILINYQEPEEEKFCLASLNPREYQLDFGLETDIDYDWHISHMVMLFTNSFKILKCMRHGCILCKIT